MHVVWEIMIEDRTEATYTSSVISVTVYRHLPTSALSIHCCYKSLANFCYYSMLPTIDLANMRYESLIACIWMAASSIGVLSLGCFLEQDIPSAITETKQFSILLLVVLS